MRDKKEVKEALISNALERQMLGLSKAEYDALTPFEIACEIEAAQMLREQQDARLRILDEHLARIEILLNGYTFQDLKSVADFRIFRSVRNNKNASKNNTKCAAAFALKRLKQKMDFIKRRDRIRALRREKEQHG